MKVVINGRFLEKPHTGIGQYTLNLVREMARLKPKTQFVVVVPTKVTLRGLGKNVKLKVLPERRLPSAGMRKTWWEQVLLPRFMREAGAEVCFFPYPSNPWAKDFYGAGRRVVVVVHDCIPWVDKRYVNGGLSRMYHYMTRKAVKLADKVMTVSGVSKKEIVEVCGVKASKVVVAWNDAAEVYKNKDVDGGALKRLGLEKKKFLLYVGGYDVRKNVRYLVREYEKFMECVDEDLPLVLAGGKALFGKLYKSFDEAFGGNLVKTGFLKEESLAALYGGCLAFVNFSEKEGFNIPIVEAANMGAPMILSDIEVHREVAGGRARLVEAEKSGAGAKAFSEMMRPEVRRNYVKQSKALAKKFSWKESAKKVLNVLFS